MWKQGEFMQTLMDGPPDPASMPDMFWQWFLNILPIALVALVFYLLSYVISLFARGGSIAEADLAWGGEDVRVRRGFSTGKDVALHVLGIDLLWLLPEILVVLLLIAVAGLSFSGFLSLMTKGHDVAGDDILRAFGGMFGGVIVLMVLSWVYRALRGIISPMMYQSVVLGRRSVGQGIAEGWALVQAHFWKLVVFWLLAMALGVGLSMFMQIFIMPLSMIMGPLMSKGLMQGADSFAETMSVFDWLLLGAISLLMGIFTWLSASFIQAFTYAMYARVYRELTQTAPAELPLEEDSAIISY